MRQSVISRYYITAVLRQRGSTYTVLGEIFSLVVMKHQQLHNGNSCQVKGHASFTWKNGFHYLKDNIMNIVGYDEQMAPGSVASSYNLLCYVHYYFKNV